MHLPAWREWQKQKGGVGRLRVEFKGSEQSPVSINHASIDTPQYQGIKITIGNRK